ncbi:hypothetical protein PHYBLDRAFT_161939 [Phycomyces blakesleeanus NRRL 1555(-)]|uniref:Uncharacterized protein n=1 Tax=Phycomyces blakesleeanus (strain ATCC 8743b / DSM 1359 / FGSC 10004 / NBRC 33097 / NRRL 1555) TaxID=763407 RepID=A0A167RC69_PHYB8|nr:hypothetical protein PHYBLDRAFT_161939 [Phycomyces blakesleeanus NRRL 1555(-)]OAD81327.1 hypothetical protein PHYBLDRAFT_161939 [Phycomyces blakesleeanus NRRL 1555(-)]|eukprot:XP_018299367.1 hypothetical protein PHYBLDRAFT_161939 [Phycomyces blakesleeanus NRRL 1555(-)]
MYQQINRYLSRREYPEDCPAPNKKKLRNRSRKYVAVEDRLHIKRSTGEPGPEVLHAQNMLRVVTEVHEEGHWDEDAAIVASPRPEIPESLFAESSGKPSPRHPRTDGGVPPSGTRENRGTAEETEEAIRQVGHNRQVRGWRSSLDAGNDEGDEIRRCLVGSVRGHASKPGAWICSSVGWPPRVPRSRPGRRRRNSWKKVRRQESETRIDTEKAKEPTLSVQARETGTVEQKQEQATSAATVEPVDDVAQIPEVLVAGQPPLHEPQKVPIYPRTIRVLYDDIKENRRKGWKVWLFNFGQYIWVDLTDSLAGQPEQPEQPEISHAESRKKLLSLKRGAIMLNISLFIGLLTRIVSFSFFHLLIFPKSDSTNWSLLAWDGFRKMIDGSYGCQQQYPQQDTLLLSKFVRTSKEERESWRLFILCQLTFGRRLEQLPLEPISQKVDKLGLITRYTSAAINPLLENLIKHVMFRWYEKKNFSQTQAQFIFVIFAYFRTSVANNKCKSCEMALLLARPDSTISKVMGTEIGQTVGYEEVKPALQALNRELVGKDLVRLALLSKKKTRLIRIVANLSWCFLSLLPIGKFVAHSGLLNINSYWPIKKLPIRNRVPHPEL